MIRRRGGRSRERSVMALGAAVAQADPQGESAHPRRELRPTFFARSWIPAVRRSWRSAIAQARASPNIAATLLASAGARSRSSSTKFQSHAGPKFSAPAGCSAQERLPAWRAADRGRLRSLPSRVSEGRDEREQSARSMEVAERRV
jgi:hypothetical protein